MSSNKYSLIGYACGAGAATRGAARAPRALRERDLGKHLEDAGAVVTDLGDISDNISDEELGFVDSNSEVEEKRIKDLAAVYWACRRLSEKVEESLRAGSAPIIIGGDHSLSIGSVAAVSNFYSEQSKKIGLIWIDTHPDINTPATSPSMGAFGMSAAILCGRVPGVLASLQKHRPAVDLKNLVYIGLRDVDPGEKEFIKSQKIAAFTTKEIDVHGMASIVKKAIEIASADTAGFVVSFDVDVCDPWIAPATGTPIRGGLTFREAQLCLELLYDSQKMLSFELVELNPLLDRNNQTTDLVISFFECAVGKSIL